MTSVSSSFPVSFALRLALLACGLAMVSCGAQSSIPRATAVAALVDPLHDPELEVIRPQPSYHAILTSDGSSVRALAWLPDSAHVVVATATHLELWRAPQRHLGRDTPILDPPPESDWLASLVWRAPLPDGFEPARINVASDGRRIALAGRESVSVYDSETGFETLHRADLVGDARLLESGELMAIGTAHTRLTLVDVETGLVTRTIATPFEPGSFAPQVAESRVAVCRGDAVAVIDTVDGSVRWEREVPPPDPQGIATADAYRCAVAWSEDRSRLFGKFGARLYAWRAEDGRRESVQSGLADGEAAPTLAFVPGEELVLAGGRAFSSRDLERRGRVGFIAVRATAVASPDGARVALGEDDSSVRLMDRSRLDWSSASIGPHTQMVVDAVWDGATETLLTVGWDEQVKRWDLERGAVVAAGYVHSAEALQLDGDLLLVGAGRLERVDMLDPVTLEPRLQDLTLDGVIVALLEGTLVWQLASSHHSIVALASGVVERTFTHRVGHCFRPAISPDRRWFAAECVLGQERNIMLVHRDDGAVHTIRSASTPTLTDTHFAFFAQDASTERWSLVVRELVTGAEVARCEETEPNSQFPVSPIVDVERGRAFWARGTSIHVCELANGAVSRARVASQPIVDLVALPTGRLAVVTFTLIRVYESAALELVNELRASTWSPWVDATFLPTRDGSLSVFVVGYSRAALWQPFSSDPVHTVGLTEIRERDRFVELLATPEPELAIVNIFRDDAGLSSGEVAALHPATARPVSLPGPSPAAAWRLLDVSPSGRLGAYHSALTRELAVWDLVDGAERGRVPVAPTTIGVAVSDGARVAWDVEGQVFVAPLDDVASAIRIASPTATPSLDFDSAGRLVVSYSRFDPVSGDPVDFAEDEAPGWCGRLGAKFDEDLLRLFDVATGQVVAETTAPNGDWSDPVFAHDDLVAVSHHDGGLLMWDLTTLTPVAGLTIAPDGRWNSWADPDWQRPAFDPADPCRVWRTAPRLSNTPALL